jgi:hypothetical protein
MMSRIRSNYFFAAGFVLLAAYFFFAYDTSVYDHLHQRLFLLDAHYFREFSLYPGGLSEWAFLFFNQFIRFNEFGSLFVPAVIVSVSIPVYHVLRRTGAFRQPLFPAFLPAALLLGLQNDYRFPLLVPEKSLLMLIFFWIGTSSSRSVKAALILLSGPVYYLLGGWFFLWTILLCALHEILSSRDSLRFGFAAAWLTAGLACPYIASRWMFSITLKEAYLYSVPSEYYFEPFMFKPDFLYYAFFLSVPALLTACFIRMKFFKSKNAGGDPGRNPSGRRAAQAAGVLLAGVCMLILTSNPQEKKKIQIDRFAGQGRWSELLSLSREIRGYDRLVNFQVNRAMAQTGVLLDSLFTADQALGTDGLFIDRILGSQISMPASDLYFDLGHVNASQVMAFEAATKFKYDPRVVMRLFMTHLINGKTGAARSYLNLIGKSLLHRGWARRNRRLLSDSAAAADPLVRVKRLRRPKADFFIDRQHPAGGLVRLFGENPDNKPAFDYWAACQLLERKVGNLAGNLELFTKMGYAGLPQAVEEAVLLYNMISPSKIPLQKYGIRPQTVRRFLGFNTILARHRMDPSGAQNILKTEFADTYWYYVRYVSPNVTAQQLKANRIHEELY